MKKILLGTSALVGSVLLAGAAMAEAPKVTVGGSLNFQAGWSDNEPAFETGGFSREFKFQQTGYVDLKAEAKSDNGLGYGGVIKLQGNTSADNDGGGLNARATYVFLESMAGRVELGNNIEAASALKVDASNFARAAGGINGHWDLYSNTAGVTVAGQTAIGTGANVTTNRFIIYPRLPSAHLEGIAEYGTRVTYYSPRFSGFQVGVSYTPDHGNRGTAAAFTSDTNGDYENVVGGGINYNGQFDQIGVAASLTGEFADNEVSTVEDMRAWAAGANVNYMGFTVGGSYGDWGETFQATTSTAKKDSRYWTAGGSYETGPFGVSFTYLNGRYVNNDSDVYSLGADYQLAPGLVPYVEVNWFDLDQAGTATDNEGTNVLFGSHLHF